MNELIKQISGALAGYRLTFGDEVTLQNQLSTIFSTAGLVFVREFKLSPGERPDFWLEPWAVEVKVGGSLDAHLRQLQRYNKHPLVAGTILIGTKPFRLPESLAGKPVGFINVGGNRL